MSSGPSLAGMALFARVVQHGGFSEAARRVGIPVSTLSRKISALETSLGVRLLERTTRAVSPTDAGREFLPYCQELLEAANGGQAALERRQQDVRGHSASRPHPACPMCCSSRWLKAFCTVTPGHR